jgi:Protein of unknown function (DUF2934)
VTVPTAETPRGSSRQRWKLLRNHIRGRSQRIRRGHYLQNHARWQADYALQLLRQSELRRRSLPRRVQSALPMQPLLEHEIRLRAYDLYDQRGQMDGHSVEDWLHAEAEILGKIVSHGA